MTRLTHLDKSGNAHMVDVSDKDETRRMAKASATINLTKTAMTALIDGNLKEGRRIRGSTDCRNYSSKKNC